MANDIVIPVTASDLPGVREQIEGITRNDFVYKTDFLEWRADVFLEPTAADLEEVNNYAQSAGMRLIVTLRHSDEGGNYQGSEQTRMALAVRAAELGAWVDREFRQWDDSCEGLKNTLAKHGGRLILSYHNFDETPKNILTIVQSMHDALVQEGVADGIVKIATYVHSENDALRVLGAGSYLYSRRRDAVTVGMGKGEHDQFAKMTREQGPPCYGNIFTFAKSGVGVAIADGMPTPEDLRGKGKPWDKDRFSIYNDPNMKHLLKD